MRLSAWALLMGNCASALAQSAPPPFTPPTREEVTRPTRNPPPPRSRLEIEGGIEKAPCALDSPEFRSIYFVLRGAEFDGLQGLTRADLASTYAQYMGRDVPLSTVCEIRDHAATILRDVGYIAAVQVPEQRIQGGIIHFQVLMAHLVQVRVRGEAKRCGKRPCRLSQSTYQAACCSIASKQSATFCWRAIFRATQSD